LELIEMREMDAARNLLRQTEVMQNVRDRQSERYLFLEKCLSMTHFEAQSVRLDG
jgi:WD40 repeat-containing protein SMU1